MKRRMPWGCPSPQDAHSSKLELRISPGFWEDAKPQNHPGHRAATKGRRIATFPEVISHPGRLPGQAQYVMANSMVLSWDSPGIHSVPRHRGKASATACLLCRSLCAQLAPLLLAVLRALQEEQHAGVKLHGPEGQRGPATRPCAEQVASSFQESTAGGREKKKSG